MSSARRRLTFNLGLLFHPPVLPYSPNKHRHQKRGWGKAERGRLSDVKVVLDSKQVCRRSRLETPWNCHRTEGKKCCRRWSKNNCRNDSIRLHMYISSSWSSKFVRIVKPTQDPRSSGNWSCFAHLWTLCALICKFQTGDSSAKHWRASRGQNPPPSVWSYHLHSPKCSEASGLDANSRILGGVSRNWGMYR